mmetsp:Transcript_3392/g.8074  ORF Transcript_3392/g.8074 Transcript_3392/m.8074 type:complete len:271 (-) Transcript_3392:1166-1978(-)
MHRLREPERRVHGDRVAALLLGGAALEQLQHPPAHFHRSLSLQQVNERHELLEGEQVGEALSVLDHSQRNLPQRLLDGFVGADGRRDMSSDVAEEETKFFVAEEPHDVLHEHGGDAEVDRRVRARRHALPHLVEDGEPLVLGRGRDDQGLAEEAVEVSTRFDARRRHLLVDHPHQIDDELGEVLGLEVFQHVLQHHRRASDTAAVGSGFAEGGVELEGVDAGGSPSVVTQRLELEVDGRRQQLRVCLHLGLVGSDASSPVGRVQHVQHRA